MSTGELEINNSQELTDKLNEIIKDPSINKPTEEEVAKAKEDFDNAGKAWANGIYKIGEPSEAQELCDYIKHFLANRFFWQKEAWMGAIKLNEELNATELLFKGKKDANLEMGYQALEFTFYVLTNPSGVGLKSALDFEEEHEIYIKTLTAVGTQLESARKSLKEIEFLQQRWGAMAQGFYLEVEEPDTEEDPEQFEEFDSEEKESE